MIKPPGPFLHAALLCLPLLVIQPAFAQQGGQYDWTSPASPWSVTCQPVENAGGRSGQACQMAQLLKVAETGQRLLHAIVRYPGDAKTPILLLALPHGLFFQAGVRLQVDAAPAFLVPYQSSDVNGAYAALALDARNLGALKRGNTLKVTVQAASRKPLTMDLSLKGFTAEFDRLTAQSGR